MPILDLAKMTKDELLRLADKIKIPVKKSMLKGEILAVLKRETKKAARLVELKKAKARADKITTKKPKVASKKVAANKTEKSKKTQKAPQPKPAAASAKKKNPGKKTTPAPKSKATAVKAQSRKTPSKTGQMKKVKTPAVRNKPVSRSTSSSRPEHAGRKGYDIKSLHPKFELEDRSQEAKFVIGKPDIRDESQAEISAELPSGYGDNKIVMLVRDPHWCYLYWELQESNIEDGLRRLSRSRNEVRHVLRIHPAQSGKTPFDVDVDFRHRNHYLQLSPGASYYTEIGLLDHEGYFAALAVSNTVTLPLDGPSEIIDEKWMTTDANFEEIYILSGGEKSGKTRDGFGQAGSAQLQNAGRGELNMSGVGSSGSAFLQEPRQEKNFSYWLDAELVLFGGADPGSTIELAGEKLDLRPDGTFTARFGLPEGELQLPVTFVSPDQSKTHTVVPNVIHHTKAESGGSDQ